MSEHPTPSKESDHDHDHSEDESSNDEGAASSYWVGGGGGKRQKKEVVSYEQEMAAKQVALSDKLEQHLQGIRDSGMGIALGDSEYVVEVLKGFKESDLFVKKVHSVLYGKGAVKNRAKSSILQFRGSSDKDGVLNRLGSWKNSELKEICKLFKLERSGTKDVLQERLLSFIVSPTSVKGLPPSKKTSLKKKTKKKKTAASSATKKPTTSRSKSSKSKPPVVSDEEEDEEEDEDESNDDSDEDSDYTAEKSGSVGRTQSTSRPRANTHTKSENPNSSATETEEQKTWRRHIMVILEDADLNTLSLKQVRQSLSQQLGMELGDRKEEISALIKDCLAEIVK